MGGDRAGRDRRARESLARGADSRRRAAAPAQCRLRRQDRADRARPARGIEPRAIINGGNHGPANRSRRFPRRRGWRASGSSHQRRDDPRLRGDYDRQFPICKDAAALIAARRKGAGRSAGGAANRRLPVTEVLRTTFAHCEPFRLWPRPCENSNACPARRNILEKLCVMRTDIADAIRLDAMLKNCIFYISPMYEFSHSVGQNR